jgi:hypothetical protein
MFLTPLRVEIVGEQLFKLTDSLIYEDDNYHIEILEGFTFDGGSIPRLLWGIIESPIGGLGSSCFCLHDCLYWTKLLSKEVADDILFDTLKASGVPMITATAIYLTVKRFSYKSYRREDNAYLYWDYVKIRSKEKGTK